MPLTLTAAGRRSAPTGVAAVTLSGHAASAGRRRAPRSRARGCEPSAAPRCARSARSTTGPTCPPGPREYLVVQRRVLPAWAVAAARRRCSCFPLLVAAVDGLARVRRRRAPVVAVAALDRRGALPVPARRARRPRCSASPTCCPRRRGPSTPRRCRRRRGRRSPRVALVLVLGFLAARRSSRGCSGRRAARARATTPGGAGRGARASRSSALGDRRVGRQPVHGAAARRPPLHLWLLAAVPEVRVPRAAGAARSSLAGLAAVRARRRCTTPAVRARPDRAGVGGRAAARRRLRRAARRARVERRARLRPAGARCVALRKRRDRRRPTPSGGPRDHARAAAYAGPGSLGGTESALRR